MPRRDAVSVAAMAFFRFKSFFVFVFFSLFMMLTSYSVWKTSEKARTSIPSHKVAWDMSFGLPPSRLPGYRANYNLCGPAAKTVLTDSLKQNIMPKSAFS